MATGTTRSKKRPAPKGKPLIEALCEHKHFSEAVQAALVGETAGQHPLLGPHLADPEAPARAAYLNKIGDRWKRSQNPMLPPGSELPFLL